MRIAIIFFLVVAVLLLLAVDGKSVTEHTVWIYIGSFSCSAIACGLELFWIRYLE